MAKPEKRWQLLLVADDGRIVPFKRIKGIVVTLVVLMVILGLACIGLVWQLTAEKVRHGNTRDRLATTSRQLDHLKGEVELITTELVLAQVRMEKAGLPVTKRHDRGLRQPGLQDEDTESAPAASQGEKQSQEMSAAATDLAEGKPPAESPEMATPATGADVAARTEAPEAATPQKLPAVAIGDLKVKHDTEKRVLLARFRVKNNAPQSGKVAGQCVVVLQNEALDTRSWVALPNVSIVDGVPDGKSGRAFRISKFVDMEMMTPAETDPSVFDVARLYVFEPTGTIMVQKDYPIALPAPLPVRAAMSPASDTETSPSAAGTGTADEPQKPMVAVGDLEMSHDAQDKILRAQFKVENRGSRSTPVSGRCVVVLKKESDDPTTWLTMPQVQLVDGEPKGMRGQAFRIARFRNMDIKARGVVDPSTFTTATVYVFDSSGTKLLERSFTVALPAPPAQPEPEAEPPPQAPPAIAPDSPVAPTEPLPLPDSIEEPPVDQTTPEVLDTTQPEPAPATDTPTAAPSVATEPSSDDPSLTEGVEPTTQEDTRSRF